MTYGFALLTLGTLFVYSGWSNTSISDVLKGLGETKGKGGETSFSAFLQGIPSGAVNAVTPNSGGEGHLARPHSGREQKKEERSLAQNHPELKPGIRAVTAVVLAQFPHLVITATTNGSHVSDSYHYKGRAVDLAGSAQEMNEAASWIHRYLGHLLTEGIHNPGLSVKYKHDVPPSYWGAETWAAHTNHIHLAV